MSNKTTDDVVLWLNGGPGCSSMLGWAQEIGPKMLYSGSKTFASYWNSYAWNKKANLLFFESPPGVGFSINNDSSYNYT
jgi:serine carboxypeptidase-like clade 2